jgi:hypothetical protein
MPTIRYPDPDRMMPHQQEVLWLDSHRFKVLIWHRRARKTTTAINEITKQALITPGIYWHLFPTYSEAKNSIWRDKNMLFGNIPKEVIEKVNESEMVVTFKNGSVYQLVGADNPDRLRGAGPKGLVLDEYDTMKNDVWPICEPILRQNGGWAWFIGTPKGKTKLYDLYNRGQNPDNKEWKSWLLKASSSGIIPQDQLEESRKTMSQALYNQEWECEFLESEGSVFRNVRDAATAVPRPPLMGHNYVMGVDLAKVQDFTVITIFDRANNWQVYQDRFQTLEWPFQKKRIIEIARHYNNALLRIDATGIGDPIVDDLARAGLSIEPVKITNETKKEMIEKLSIWIEQKKCRIINMADTMLEFDNFSYEIGLSGRIVYNAREGYHDDIVISMALAVYGLVDIYIQPKPEEIPLIRQEYRHRLLGDRDRELNENDYEAI